MTSTDRTPLVIPPVDFDTPTGDEMVAIDKGFGGGPVGGRQSPPFRPDWSLIVCRECRRRMFDGEGRSIHRAFTCIPTRAQRRGQQRMRSDEGRRQPVRRRSRAARAGVAG